MALYELTDDSLVGQLVRVRVQHFERDHPPVSVYVSDRRGMWDVRITEGETTKGTAYISAPGSFGKVGRIHWPPGDIEVLTLLEVTSLESLVLKVLEFEEEKMREA
jgi:hypothetical protein